VRAIFAGNALPSAERTQIAAELAALTGLPAKTWLDQGLKISLGEFGKLILKDEGLAVGDYDARYTLPLNGASADPVIDDPAMGQYTPGFVTGFNQYLRDELKVISNERYVPIAWSDVNFRWDWNSGGMSQTRDYAQDLAAAMRRNPQLRLFIGVGYYDLVTTLGGAQYSMTHAPIPVERLTFKTYESGHMPYLGNESGPALAADMRAFIRAATGN
jgi:carboxypeptidase C (cathepsin A)